MDTIVVLKFGGSSVSDNDKLKIVADKIICEYKKNNKVVVVLSAQGKTTDKLIEQANELSDNISKRELDVLLSCGEQISISKLAILLNSMGYKSISLTGWQAGIYTNNTNQNAIIERINTKRILEELNNNKIVIVAGFQGLNEKLDITTLGRGGSDTTAVAIAAALKAKKCYIFSDVDGVYTTDPNKVKDAKKLSNIAYDEMLEISSEGAKVLHNRCIEIGEKYNIPIITESTFNNKEGSIISDKIEENSVKSIVKKEISRISIVGNGVSRNIYLIKNILNIIDTEKLEILNFEVSESKISITFKNIIEDRILNIFHNEIFKS
ncbi:MAG: aspartate kinase [Clostridia bacterium]|nr:aspartate kinase [Clostridia bacterium]